MSYCLNCPWSKPIICQAICVAIISSLVTLSAGPLATKRFQVDSTGRILVPVNVDGKAHTFVIDTATRYTTINAAVAATLQRKIQESHPGVQTIDDVSLEVLGMVLPHQPVRVASASTLDEGIVGAELCKRFIVKVDFRARRITLWPPSASVGTRHAVGVPADFSNDVPAITATVSAKGVKPSVATLAVGLAVAPGAVSFRYGYAADSGLLDASQDGTLPIELRGLRKASIAARAQIPREPERATTLVFTDGVVSARALTASWIVFDAPHGRIVLGQ